MINLTMKLLSGVYGICRLENNSSLPEWVNYSDFYTVTRTFEELSIVCSQKQIPDDIKCEKDWRILKVEGTLDFSLIGILASISTALARQGISIFAISTYDTDYILIKEKDIASAVTTLINEGYSIISYNLGGNYSYQ